MSILRLGPYSATVDNLVVARVRLWSNAERAKHASNGHIVRVGVQRLTGVAWLAVWKQTEQTLRANTSRILSGSDDLNYPLDVGDVLVAECESYGTPASPMNGLVAELQLTRVGEVEPGVVEARPGLPGAQRIRRPLISNPRVGDRDLAAIARQINDGGLPDFSIPVYFSE